MNKENVHADLMIAKGIIYGEANNPYMYNMAAYHSVQAIEKCMKELLLRTKNYEEESLKTHNVPELLVKLEREYEGFINAHPVISDNAHQYMMMNQIRYEDKLCPPLVVKGIYKQAQRLYGETYSNIKIQQLDTKAEIS